VKDRIEPDMTHERLHRPLIANVNLEESRA
jgi:hypothetical protein